MSQDALKSSPVGFAAVGTSTCEHNEYSLLSSVLCALRVALADIVTGVYVMLFFRAFYLLYYICIIHLYNISMVSRPSGPAHSTNCGLAEATYFDQVVDVAPSQELFFPR